MCNNCNCDFYDKCSIVGFMPVGFCCSNCYLYDENHTCLYAQTRHGEKKGSARLDVSKDLRPISTTIENGLLKVVISQKDKEIPIIIDLQKQLESK